MAGDWGTKIATAWKAFRNPGVTQETGKIVKEVITKTARITPQTLEGRMRKLELEALKVYDDYVEKTGKVYGPGGGGWTQSVAKEQHARMKEFWRLIGEINKPDTPPGIRWFKFRNDPTHRYRNFERGFH